MMIRITSIVALMLISGLAYAQEKTTVTSLQGMLGFNVEVDVDKIKSAQGSFDGDDDDLESNFGVMGAVDFLMKPNVYVGARGAAIIAKGDDIDADFTTLDGGVWARYVFPSGQFEPFIAGGAGLTYMLVDGDFSGQDFDASGLGFHVLIGGGASHDTGSLTLIGGLYYLYQKGDLEENSKTQLLSPGCS